jgi:hypothetical protein
MAGQYERLYDSSLLDDLHNYFPALLYDSSRFSSVADVIAYVQQQTRNRFDLYSYGLNQYRDRNPTSPVSAAASAARRPVAASRPEGGSSVRSTAVPIYAFDNPNSLNSYSDINYTVSYAIPQPTRNNAAVDELEAQWADIDAIMGGAGANNTTMTLLGTLLNGLTGGRQRRVPSNFMSPVIVRPSEEQIAAGSRLDFVGAVTDMQCAVCQAGFEIGEERRTLSACEHEFHRACIDPWFQQNVHCPVCRHDIREPANEDSS